VEHIKSAVRSSPQDAAQILGISLYLTNHLLQKPNRASERDWSTTSIAQDQIRNTACRFYVSSAVELWSTRSSSRQDPHDTESNVCTTSSIVYSKLIQIAGIQSSLHDASPLALEPMSRMVVP
jgi:hypothetical protein